MLLNYLLQVPLVQGEDVDGLVQSIQKRRKLKSLKAIIKETSSHYHVLDIDVDECYIEDIIEQANLIKNQYDSACETLDIVLKNHFSDIYYTLEPDYAGTKCEEIALEMTY